MSEFNGKADGPILTKDMEAKVLRKMNHRQWLGEFSKVLQMQRPGQPAVMTPFRAGAVARLQLAEQYIALLEKELHWLSRDNKLLRRQVVHLGGVASAPFDGEAEKVHGEADTPADG